jgi:hypothetical protein
MEYSLQIEVFNNLYRNKRDFDYHPGILHPEISLMLVERILNRQWGYGNLRAQMEWMKYYLQYWIAADKAASDKDTVLLSSIGHEWQGWFNNTPFPIDYTSGNLQIDRENQLMPDDIVQKMMKWCTSGML